MVDVKTLKLFFNILYLKVKIFTEFKIYFPRETSPKCVQTCVTCGENELWLYVWWGNEQAITIAFTF